MEFLPEILGNHIAKQMVSDYLKNGAKIGLTLYGTKGVGKYTIALNVAASILKCTVSDITTHPDACIIHDDEKKITVDTVAEVQNFCSFVPSQGNKKVIIIDNAETMNSASQNKMLKVLEDHGSNIFIFISTRKLLDTIHSRTRTIQFRQIDDEFVQQYIKSRNETSPIPIPAYGGSIGNYELFKSDKQIISSITSILQRFESLNSKAELLDTFHLWKEKDKYEMFTLHKEHIDVILNILESIFNNLYLYKIQVPFNTVLNFNQMNALYSEDDTMEIINAIHHHKKEIHKNSSYNKNDFFNLISLMAIEK